VLVDGQAARLGRTSSGDVPLQGVVGAPGFVEQVADMPQQRLGVVGGRLAPSEGGVAQQFLPVGHQ